MDMPRHVRDVAELEAEIDKLNLEVLRLSESLDNHKTMLAAPRSAEMQNQSNGDILESLRVRENQLRDLNHKYNLLFESQSKLADENDKLKGELEQAHQHYEELQQDVAALERFARECYEEGKAESQAELDRLRVELKGEGN